MKKITMILAALLVCGVAWAAQDVTLDLYGGDREVRDPRLLKTWLETNAADAESRIAAVEAGLQTTTATVGALAVQTNATVGGTLGVTGVATFTAESVHNLGIDADYITVDAAAGIDTKTAGALKVGAATATSLDLGASDITTSVAGPLVAPRVYAAVSGTSTNFALTSANYGEILVITNALADITLPANGAAIGSWIDIAIGAQTGAADDSCAVTVSAATTDTLIGPNDVDLKSVTWGSGHRINAYAKFWSDGAFWHVQNLGGTTMTYND